LSAEKDIALAAKGNVRIKADKGVVIEGNTISLKGQQLELAGQSQVGVKGAKLELTADATLALKGAAQTSLASDAMLELKGALVKIN
jgi:hypothetical protein